MGALASALRLLDASVIFTKQFYFAALPPSWPRCAASRPCPFGRLAATPSQRRRPTADYSGRATGDPGALRAGVGKSPWSGRSLSAPAPSFPRMSSPPRLDAAHLCGLVGVQHVHP
jgi:hypothetical protein